MTDDAPLAKPDHLAPVASRAAGRVAFALGVLAIVVALIASDRAWQTPDWRIASAGFVATAIAAAVSLARRERAYAWWLGGLGLAAAAFVVGWLLVFALVLAATALLIAILHHVL